MSDPRKRENGLISFRIVLMRLSAIVPRNDVTRRGTVLTITPGAPGNFWCSTTQEKGPCTPYQPMMNEGFRRTAFLANHIITGTMACFDPCLV